MARERKSKIKIEDLPRPAEQLSPEQAEKLTGGAFSKSATASDDIGTFTDWARDVTGPRNEDMNTD